jgi:hypothetical protein
VIADGEVLPAGLVAERAGESAFADAARAYQHSLARADPCTEGHLEKQRAIVSAGGAVIDVLDVARWRRRDPGAGLVTSSDGAAPSAGRVKMVSLDGVLGPRGR